MANRSNKEHKQAPITYEDEVIFSVDKKLQNLIQFLFDNGIDTFNSCEDDDGACLIEYELNDWIEIAETAFNSHPKDLYRFIEEECEVLLLSTDDGELDENDEYWIEGENLIWSASVRFPKKLLPIFEALIRSTLEDPIFDSEEEPKIH